MPLHPFDTDLAECARAVNDGRAEPDDWHPTNRGTNSWALARAICAECPLRVECAAWAEKSGARGVWGGRLFTGTYLSKNLSC